MNTRLRILLFLGIIFLAVIVIKLFMIQIIDYVKYKEYSLNNRIRLVNITPQRGNIYDHDKKLLADSRPSYNVILIEEDIKDKEKTILFLEETLDIGRKYIEKKLGEYRYQPYTPVVIKRDISLETVASIEEDDLDYPGVVVERVPVRHYVYGSVGSTFLGYVGRISGIEYKSRKDKGYSVEDVIGRTGIEKEYEAFLRGKPGGMQVQVDSLGYRDKVLKTQPSVRGYDIYTTVDIDLQRDVEKTFKDIAAGVVIVMNPRNGNILAMASKPSFNPNVFSGSAAGEEISRLINNKSSPLLNRAVRGFYPPGSIFKLVVMLAFLERNGFSVSAAYTCNGEFPYGDTVFNCWNKEGHGQVSLLNAVKYSCNVYFFNEGLKCGVDSIINKAKSFGFGEKTGIDISGELSPELPARNWKKRKFGQPWYKGDTVNLSIGQGYMLVTPIQTAVFLSAIANGGKIYRPRTVQYVAQHDTQNKVKEFLPFVRREPPVRQKQLDIIKESMWKVVSERGGTGMAAAVEGFDVCGKTGTAEYGKGTHAWFCGFAPRDNPEVVVVVLVEGGESGGKSAAPIAGEIFKSYLKNKNK
ncbi:MAG: penicillin-binding protein 2 [Candidatus Aureabacteria bacterium]|nr:penicillin-binding protein 2 [Candidatus Auribacterota bacterium]